MKDEQWAISSESHMNWVFESLAYSVGAVLGDGYMRYVPSYGNGSWYMVEVSTMDREIVERFLGEVNLFFGTNYKIMSRVIASGTTIYTGRTSRKAIYDFFYSITNGKNEVPIEAFRTFQKTKADFIAGLFDTDGTVREHTTDKGNKRWQLGFSNNKLLLIGAVASILQKAGVKVGSIGQNKKGGYSPVFSIYPNIRDFIDKGFYFNAPRKQNRLLDYVRHMVGSETMYAAS